MTEDSAMIGVAIETSNYVHEDTSLNTSVDNAADILVLRGGCDDSIEVPRRVSFDDRDDKITRKEESNKFNKTQKSHFNPFPAKRKEFPDTSDNYPQVKDWNLERVADSENVSEQSVEDHELFKFVGEQSISQVKGTPLLQTEITMYDETTMNMKSVSIVALNDEDLFAILNP